MSWFPAVLPRGCARPRDQRSWQLVPVFTGLVELPLETVRGSWADEPHVEDSRLCLVDAVPQLLVGRDRLRRLEADPQVRAGGGAWARVGGVTTDGRTCAVEYPGGRAGTSAPDEVGVATHACGPHGRVAQERRYRVHESCPRTETGRG